ncbi:nuclear transport factor 2 family protein [Pseudonocardia sp. TRM90224]|uniref:nuclear transport factor 2 family protein n=1 Tax=Pseudonocardia sp. TRM90224 TaxID=2812678 RepID=UPI001E5C28F5|nr:nuclear transport factor 2 family protein [Pseudonocardia sp. TRM90224]
MPLTADDTLAIHHLLAMHGHLVDSGDLGRLDELFTPDAVYDVSALGQRPLRSIAEFRAATEAFADHPMNPVGHHVTNILVTELPDGTVTVASKGIGVRADGTAGSVTYRDRVVRCADGWRIAERCVSPARERA